MALKIRPKQMAAFNMAAAKRFEDEMWIHLSEDFADDHCSVIGEARVREVIRVGIERAEEFGFSNRGPVRFYIELMFVMGADFHEDPQFSWAANILNKTTTASQMIRADDLFRTYQKYRRDVMGDRNKLLAEAQNRGAKISLVDFEVDDGDVKGAILAEAKKIYPQKIHFMGLENFERLVDQAISVNKKHNAMLPSSMYISTGCALMMGHHYDTDPLYYWAGKTLNSNLEVPPDERFERLFTKTIHYSNEALKSLM